MLFLVGTRAVATLRIEGVVQSHKDTESNGHKVTRGVAAPAGLRGWELSAASARKKTHLIFSAAKQPSFSRAPNCFLWAEWG